ncbi:MAG: hypothetical protein H0W68_09450 [Gemmatimonadaceae bacterium]|nr:hypothetical protein [Geodermatophilaceae bacterium]MBA3672231.1 hypothetical protein [Gemmatimonadaceae bacterium]
MSAGSPAGYVRVAAGGQALVVKSTFETDARVLASTGTPYDAAAKVPGARALQGRGPAYAIPLPVTRVPAVVRRNRHGGLFARLTGDRFLFRSRAALELRTSLRLMDVGVPTPVILMYSEARVAGLWIRADVVTHEIGNARDLASFLTADEPAASRREAWEVSHSLLRLLAAAGARHHDLNLKNILLASTPSGLSPYILDVDRVTFSGSEKRTRRANARRLAQSARKWLKHRGATVLSSELNALEILQQG